MQSNIYILMLASVIFQGTIAPQVKTIRNRNDAEMVITGTHTKVFGKNNLITSRITPAESNEWYVMLSNVKEFVDKTAKDKSLTSGKWSAYETILDLSNKTINTLKTIFNSQIAPALKNPADKNEGISNYDPNKLDRTKLDLNVIRKLVNELQLFKAVLVKLQNDLKQTKAKKSKAVQDAHDIFSRLALTLEVTIDKISTDLNKIR